MNKCNNYLLPSDGFANAHTKHKSILFQNDPGYAGNVTVVFAKVIILFLDNNFHQFPPFANNINHK